MSSTVVMAPIRSPFWFRSGVDRTRVHTGGRPGGWYNISSPSQTISPRKARAEGHSCGPMAFPC